MLKNSSPVFILFLLISSFAFAAPRASVWEQSYAAHPLKAPHEKDRTIGTKYFHYATYAVTEVLARISDFADVNSARDYGVLMDLLAHEGGRDLWLASGLVAGLLEDASAPLSRSIGFLLVGEARARFPVYSRERDAMEIRNAQVARARLVLAWKLNRFFSKISGLRGSVLTWVTNRPEAAVQKETEVRQLMFQGAAACSLLPTAFCRATRDVMTILNPVVSPAGDQLEGGTRFLAEIAYADLVRKGPISRELKRLSRASALEWKSLHALSNRSTEERLALIRARALASHNHGVENHLVLHSVWNAPSPDRAIEIVESALLSIQKIYRVGPSRDAVNASLQIPRGAERTYHFWGGAWIAAELQARGHSGEVARDWSARLGLVYEAITLKGESWAASSADAELHRTGAEWATP